MKHLTLALFLVLGLFSIQSVQAAPKKQKDSVTLEEYVAKAEAVAKKKGRSFEKKKVVSRFKRMDADKDGLLTLEERKAFAEKNKK